MENDSLLSFPPPNFYFHKSTRTSVHTPPCCWQGTGRSARRHLSLRHQSSRTIPLPPPSHHQHHTIDDGHCRAFCVRFLSWFLSLHTFKNNLMHCPMISFSPTNFIWKSRFFFLTSSLRPRDARYQDEELWRPWEWVARHFQPSSADHSASSSTTRSWSIPLFCEWKCYWECRFSGYDYCHCDVRSYDEKKDRGYSGEKELLCGDTIIKWGSLLVCLVGLIG